MTTNFEYAARARGYNDQVVDLVKKDAEKHCIDLNSVDYFTDAMLIVGESKCGKTMHVKQRNDGWMVTIFLEPEGSQIESYVVQDLALQTHNEIHVYLENKLDGLYCRWHEARKLCKQNNLDARRHPETVRLGGEIANVKRAIKAMGQQL